MIQKKNQRLELLVYLVLWTMLFLTPIISLYVHIQNHQEAFRWNEVFHVWGQYAIFLVFFLIHNFLLAPLFVYKKRKTLYLTILILIIAVFCIVQCSGITAPERPQDLHEHFGERPPKPIHEDGEMYMYEDDGEPRSDDMIAPPFSDDHMHAGDENFEEVEKPHRPPLIFGEHDVISIIILILMLGANLGFKLYLKQRQDEKAFAELEKKNLEQQLEYLKYQINPHFLMNTLNNIHALIDIDPQIAKDSIVDLSKIMRFVLYEGSKQTVPLERELQFLKDYVKLMRLRVSDKVPITVDIDEQPLRYEIPPLLLITFVENAFKHGISYNKPSFIDIQAKIVNNRFIFYCKNSKVPIRENSEGGIGLQNIKKRLELIYGENYTLNINEDPNIYQVQLEIPLTELKKPS